MASATGSAKNRLRRFRPWEGQWTIAHRILALNLLIVVVFAVSVLYLDAFRNQLQDERIGRLEREAQLISAALSGVPQARRGDLVERMSTGGKARARLYAGDGKRLADSWDTTGPTYELRDPATQPWRKSVARALDRGFNALVGAGQLDDFTEPAIDHAAAWPELQAAMASEQVADKVRNAPDLTPVFSVGAPVADGGQLLLTVNDRDFTRTIRKERGSLAIAMAIAVLMAALLSFFLARTIVRPLRRIALAAHRVRLGRAREVKVPRLPSRRDEIGSLARAVSDMSQALRHRIDNIEAFAADVTHELKNPLASLRSAVDSLERVEDVKVRNQLFDVVRQDVVRLDRLINDVGEAARTDAELARARFEPIDLGPLIQGIVSGWETRRETGNVRIAFARPRRDSTIVMGEPGRLARAIDNIIDNAISFSPAGGLVEIAAIHVGDNILIRVDDEGPGVPNELREAIFNRFHSVRPKTENFGRHSGLGLAIARAIVEGHDGEIDVADRDDAPSGARFTITLPAADLA
jgi:two-component system, OmpR family, sensor histidine kinase ChvG